ncbi:MAG: hypothetical protein RLZZ50_1581, partial [Verrucomicrobiota bacterium]
SEPSAAAGGHDNEYDTFSDYSAMSYCGPYGVPLRILMAKDCDNLMMAGRNVSVTHAALGTVRVMGTTALMGEAAGIAAALSATRGRSFDQLASEDIGEIQQRLLANGCFLPNKANSDPADLALAAKASASSTAPIHGVAPETPGFHEGLAVWKDQPQYKIERLETRRGQLIATSGGSLDFIELCLSNESSEPQSIDLALHLADHIWDYRSEPGAPLANGRIVVAPGGPHWVRWTLALALPATLRPGAFLRVDALPNKSVLWHCAQKIIPGHMAMYAISPGRMRRYGNGHTLAYRVSPAQQPFGAEQVITGVTRPHRQTNLWVSDPAQPLPQSLQLDWDKPQTVRRVQVVFPGHLIREYHAYAPFYRDAQCPRDYRVEAETESGWTVLVSVKDNYQRLRRHELFTPVSTRRLRVVVTATNGDPSAAIYEVRCY